MIGLGSLQTFQDLIGATLWRELLRRGSLRSFHPGRTILRQGDPGGFVFALEHGRVKLLARAEDGAELMLTVRGSGHLIGELAGDASGRRTASVETIDRCTAHYLGRSDFDRFVDEHHLRDVLHQYQRIKFDQAVNRQVELAHRPAVRRIARLLHDVVLAAPPGLPNPERIPFTQEELSSSLGMARSTVADQLGKLRAAGALAPGPQLVVADLARLGEWAAR
ncbi:CRP-like cAMP-binding protein [Kribbella pratensis]|uniref:CRP-like cAMP-binding protein n=1 Tax=Kribbella pratensis TaxID=2512112 RepID=A0ABY2F4D7_9ACTN|nr:Crp/Fnr family transcriptional regulator [Kribbella pratensis]TDW81409.1 CRP-like cAMP-binding protein [Kribbella pratensis]